MRKSCHVRVRRFEERDAEEVSALIARTLRTTNRKDYTEAYIENDVRTLTPAYLIKRAAWTHFYVFCAAGRIVGCGAIGPYWDKENESSLFTIFVLPEYQGKGIGRKIVETLEGDEYFLRAERIEIPASVTARGFIKRWDMAIKAARRFLMKSSFTEWRNTAGEWQ